MSDAQKKKMLESACWNGRVGEVEQLLKEAPSLANASLDSVSFFFFFVFCFFVFCFFCFLFFVFLFLFLFPLFPVCWKLWDVMFSIFNFI